MAEEEIKNSEVKIANKDLQIYLGECILRFQSQDQLVLSAQDKEKAKKILCFLNPLGVIADEKFTSGDVDYRSPLKKYIGEPNQISEEVKIADRDIRVYLGSVAMVMFYKDTVILSAGKSFNEKMRYVANILNALGVVLAEGYKKKNGKMEFKEREVEILDKSTGREEKRIFCKLGITKIPELKLANMEIKERKGELLFKEEQCEIQNKGSGRGEIKTFYKLGLTKIPEIFMYTDPDKAVEYPGLEE